MANTREEVLNTVVASMLSKYDSIEAAPEQREGPEAIDITVRHENARNTEVVIEAKIGTSAGKKKGATKQVRQRLESRPSAMAFAVCYPNDLKSLASLSQLETGMANTQQLWFAPVTRVGKAPTGVKALCRNLPAFYSKMIFHKVMLRMRLSIRFAKRQI